MTSDMKYEQPERIFLAQTPTPIESLDELIPGTTILVKRDDLTGTLLSGNKIRKLEFLLAEAQALGKKRVLTCGGIQSNHCRATAIASRRLGMDSLLFLRADAPPDVSSFTGNLKLNELVGADIRFITSRQYESRVEIMKSAAGEDDYIIPEGGSNALGAWGYICAVDEMTRQWKAPPSSIICATGSGGTLAGIIMGLQRRHLDIPAYGVCVCNDAPTFQNIVSRICNDAHERWPQLPSIAADQVNIIDGYVGRGYALSTPDELADIKRIASLRGLFFDPVYTGKAFRALLYESHRFGARPLFIHTGGVFGLLAH